MEHPTPEESSQAGDAGHATATSGGAELEAGDGAVDPSSLEPAHAAAARPDGRSTGFGVALLLGAAAVVAALITARASVLGSEATDLWQKAVREEARRGAILIQGVRYTYGDEADTAFMIATSEARAAALEEASAVASPDVASRLAAEARVHAQVADAMRGSVNLADDPAFMLPNGGYDLQASLATARREAGDDRLTDPTATVAAGDAASQQAIRLLAVTIVAGLAFLAGSLAQVVASRRRLLLIIGWGTLTAAGLLAIAIEVTA